MATRTSLFFSLADLLLNNTNMDAVGIDMGKDSFFASLGDRPSAEFANDAAGIRGLVRAMGSSGLVPSGTTVGVEATGTYHLLLAGTLRSEGWGIVVVNPLVTSRMTKATLRQVKNDRVDAATVRKAVLLGEGRPYDASPDLLLLKALVSQRLGLKRMETQCKQRSHAHLYRQRASEVDIPDVFPRVQAGLHEEILAVEREMALVAPDAQALLRSIPGIGALSAASLVASVGDIRSFPSPEKLVAFVGLDCRVHESGTSVRGKGYITKRGNAGLRAVLFNAAFIAKRHNPALGRFFEKKVAEGKHHTAALCAVERKLVHLVWAVWTRGTPYEAR